MAASVGAHEEKFAIRGQKGSVFFSTRDVLDGEVERGFDWGDVVRRVHLCLKVAGGNNFVVLLLIWDAELSEMVFTP